MDDRTDITPEQLEQGMANLLQTVDSGAKWFYWIAGLSLVNYISSLTNSGFGFAIGLNIAFSPSPSSIIAILLFALFGFMGVKRKQWALITGFILYILDGAIVIPAFFNVGFDFWLLVNAGFHVFALYGIFQAIRANSLLKKLERLVAEAEREAQFAGTAPGVPPPPYNPIEGQVNSAMRNEPPMPKE